MDDHPPITSYRAFWPYYLREHSNATNRRLHFAGTAAALGLLAWAVLSGQWGWLGLALVAGYGPAWLGHFTCEHNKPATFRYPVWSLISDFRMFGLMLTGQLGKELRRLDIP